MWKREQRSPEESLLRLWDLKKASGLPIQEVTPCCQWVVFLPESYCCHNLLVKDADKLTLGQQITVVALHTLESIIKQPPDRWMTNTRMTHYQSILLTKRVIFASPVVLNPATLLPETDDSSPTHHCADILAEETGTRNDLKDQPLPGSLS